MESDVRKTSYGAFKLTYLLRADNDTANFNVTWRRYALYQVD